MSNETYQHFHAITVERHNGQRLDIVAKQLFDDYSRTQLQRCIQEGRLLVNGKKASAHSKVYQNMSIDLYYRPQPSLNFQPQPIAIDVIFEDDHILIINKPAGLVVHPAVGNPHSTLLNALLYYAPDLANLPRAGIIHRLDKDTTGLLVIAKTSLSRQALSQQLQKHSVKRRYLAIVCGKLNAAGKVDAPIARHPVNRKKMAVMDIHNQRAKTALTHYHPVQQLHGHSLIELSLKTGRTHQIRVHMQHIKHPVLGDPVYNAHRMKMITLSAEQQQLLTAFNRQALHAWQLEFIHPHNQQVVKFEVAMPTAMSKLVDMLRQQQD